MDDLLEILKNGDDFEKAMARFELINGEYQDELLSLVQNENAELRLQSLIDLTTSNQILAKEAISGLLIDENSEIRKTVLMYIDKKRRIYLTNDLALMLSSELVGTELFDIYLSTIQHLQPQFIESFSQRSIKVYEDLGLPAGYIEGIIFNDKIPEQSKTFCLPYLKNTSAHQRKLLILLEKSSNTDFRIGLIKSIQSIRDKRIAQTLIEIALNKRLKARLRAQAQMTLLRQDMIYGDEIVNILSDSDSLLQYASIKYLCNCEGNDLKEKEKVNKLIDLGT